MSSRPRDELPERVHQPDEDWQGLTDAQVITSVEGDLGDQKWRAKLGLGQVGPNTLLALVFVVALVCATVIGARDGPQVEALYAIVIIVVIAVLRYGDIRHA